MGNSIFGRFKNYVQNVAERVAFPSLLTSEGYVSADSVPGSLQLEPWPSMSLASGTDMQALKDRVQELEGEVEMLRDEKAWLQDEVDYLKHALGRASKDPVPF